MRERSTVAPLAVNGIETADLLKRSGRGAHIFERGLRHDAALVDVPVVAELGQRAVDLGVVAGAGDAEPGVAARIDLAETVNQRDGPGPRPLVDRGVEAELGEIERRRLQRQRNVDGGAALVDRKAEVDAGRNARAEPGDAAPGLAPIADEIGLAGRSWPRFRRPRPRSGTAGRPSPRKHRRRPDCSATRARTRMTPGLRAAPGNCCRDWSRPRRPTRRN